MPADDAFIQCDDGVTDSAFFDLPGRAGRTVEHRTVVTDLVVMRVTHIDEKNRVAMN